MAVTSAIISLAATAVGTGVQAYAQRQRAKTEAAVLERNAKQKEFDAEARRLEVQAQQKHALKAGQKRLDKSRKLVFSRGLELDGGPLEVLAEDTANLELQVAEIGRVGSSEIERLRRGAEFDIFKSKEAKKAGDIAAGTTILAGVGQGAGQFNTFKQNGTF